MLVDINPYEFNIENKNIIVSSEITNPLTLEYTIQVQTSGVLEDTFNYVGYNQKYMGDLIKWKPLLPIISCFQIRDQPRFDWYLNPYNTYDFLGKQFDLFINDNYIRSNYIVNFNNIRNIFGISEHDSYVINSISKYMENDSIINIRIDIH